MAIDPTRFGSADPGPFFHGTRADLRPGDLLTPGDVFTLRNNITTPRDSNQIRWDGIKR